MKIEIIKIFRALLSIFPNRVLVILLEQIFIVLKVKPLKFAYERIGINETNADKGERMFLMNDLPRILKIEKETGDITIFDVGANNGKYSQWINGIYVKARIHSFEPLPDAFRLLKAKFGSNKNISLINSGLSDTHGTLAIHTYANDSVSEHATLHPEVLKVAHGSDDNLSIDIPVTTIDRYCKETNIESIDFMKIDTEGHEISVLKGTLDMLRNNRVGVIQFEFNEMNVFSRVFLNDFFDLLKGYQFYRISNRGLVALGSYSTEYEIFRFQNIIAVNTAYK